VAIGIRGVHAGRDRGAVWGIASGYSLSVKKDTRKVAMPLIKSRPDTPITNVGIEYSKSINTAIEKTAYNFYRRNRRICRNANLFELGDWIQEGWLYLSRLKQLPTDEAEIVRLVSNHYSSLMKKSRNRIGILQETPYNELSDNDRVRYDNEVYAYFDLEGT